MQILPSNLHRLPHFFLLFGVFFAAACLAADEAVPQKAASPLGDLEQNRQQLDRYFRRETQWLAAQSLDQVQTLEDWLNMQAEYRRQLAEMLGLDPLPPRTDLQPTITGTDEEQGIVVERLHFQSSPGLYVTANFYRPAEVTQPLPAILYLCGHARAKVGDVSYGNKTAYHHHGVWFAKHGFVCLTIDTIQLGEIEGDHHGTHNLNQWWWNSRGYTPAGVEAWNGIRALDYLEQRPEVDASRMGVTGRSGGGAYTWWVSALDTRVAAAVPVAGITSLHNHVVDGCVAGHCDCMYMVNTYRWDFPKVAALVAPRPLLIANSDNDSIFPLDGVIDVHTKVRRIYRLLGAADKLGLNITPGPHTDTQDLQVPAFRWFNHYLRDSDQPIEQAAVSVFSPQQLRVFDSLPADERVTTIQREFVPAVPNTPLPTTWLPKSTQHDSEDQVPTWSDLESASQSIQSQLANKVFAGWPETARVPDLEIATRVLAEWEGLRFSQVDFTSQHEVRLSLYMWELVKAPDHNAEATVALHLFDETHKSHLETWTALAAGKSLDTLPADQQTKLAEHKQLMKDNPQQIQVCFAPRGIGPAAWSGNAQDQIHIRRRFMLLGQTLAGMQVWDIQRALKAVQQTRPEAKISLHGRNQMGGLALFAALAEPAVVELHLQNPPTDHKQAADLLNVAKIVEPRQLVGLLLSQGIDLQVASAPEHFAAWTEVARAIERLQPDGQKRGRFSLARMEPPSP